MWMAAHAAKAHTAVFIIVGLVVAGVIGMITTHKGNRR